MIDINSHTPGDWEVKEVMGQLFIAAKPYEGHPYYNRTRTIEIMSDEEYPTKVADVYLIAQAPALVRILQEALAESGCDGDLCAHRWHEEARAVIGRTKVPGKV
jgi:hypothetical protein